MGRARAVRAIFVSFGRTHLGMKPMQRGRAEMEKEIATLRSWLVQWCDPINSLFCFGQLELGFCYWYQGKFRTQKLESEMKF